MALLGENGAGKSTLIKALTGVYHADHGTIWLEGQAISPKNTACTTTRHQHRIAGSQPATQYVGR